MNKHGVISYWGCEHSYVTCECHPQLHHTESGICPICCQNQDRVDEYKKNKAQDQYVILFLSIWFLILISCMIYANF